MTRPLEPIEEEILELLDFVDTEAWYPFRELLRDLEGEFSHSCDCDTDNRCDEDFADCWFCDNVQAGISHLEAIGKIEALEMWEPYRHPDGGNYKHLGQRKYRLKLNALEKIARAAD